MALIAQAVLIAAVVSELRMHEAVLGYSLEDKAGIRSECGTYRQEED